MALNLNQPNEMKSFIPSSNGDEKFNMNRQLNSNMSIQPKAPDSFENKIHSVNGGSSE